MGEERRGVKRRGGKEVSVVEVVVVVVGGEEGGSEEVGRRGVCVGWWTWLCFCFWKEEQGACLNVRVEK